MGKMKNLSIDLIENETRDIEDTLDARGENYGQYIDVSLTAQMLKNTIRNSASWGHMEFYMQESLDMICNKLARIANGNPYYDDSWHDIAGYARLVETELEKIK